MAKRLCLDQLESPVVFVPQSALPMGEPYERYIFNSKQCPTRDGLHDFFNGLCWLRFPLTKTRLNQLQAEQIAQLGSVTTRGAVRDALTLFDENAALFIAPPALWEALLAKDWARLFVELRPLWQEAQLVLFGHALLEKLVYPRKTMTAHIFIAHDDMKIIANKDQKMANPRDSDAYSNTLKTLDAFIAAQLTPAKLATKPFAPLPVLGVPGWWAANEQPDFYADTTVFRPPR